MITVTSASARTEPAAPPGTCRSQQRACQRPCPRTGRTKTRRQLRDLHRFQHRHPVLVKDLLNKTLENPSWEKTLKTKRWDNNGHVSSLVQELRGPHSERPQENHGHVNNLLQELHDATRRHLHPHQPGTHSGAPGRRPRRCDNDRRIALYRALGSAGAWVTLPKEATPDGQVLRATTPEGVSPIIGLVALILQTPGRLLASPSGANPDRY